MPRNNNMPSFGGTAVAENPWTTPAQSPNVDPWAPVGSAMNADPWANPMAQSPNVDPWASPVGQSPNADPWAAPSASNLEAMYTAPAFSPDREAGKEKRESLVAKLKGALGRVAARMSGVSSNVDLAGTFGAGGSVSRGIDTASSVVGRADSIANGRMVNMAGHVPVIGNYVRAGKEIVGAAKSVADIAGNYDNVAQGVGSAYDARGQLAGAALDYGKGAGKRVAVESAGAALNHVLENAGIGQETDAKGELVRKVRIGKMAKFAVRAVRTGGGSLAETGSAAVRVGLETAKTGINTEVATASANIYQQSQTMYNTGSSDWLNQSGW